MDAEWHYIEHEKLGVELYKVKEDPLELNNLAQSRGMQHIIKAFRSQLSQTAVPPPIGTGVDSGEQLSH